MMYAGDEDNGDDVTSGVLEDEQLECLDADVNESCVGTIEYRMPLTVSLQSFPRCERHWHLALDRYEKHTAVYPDSPIPPSWFDPSAAGERWDED